MLVILVAILLIVSLWKIFQKAGQPGWAALIPIYNTYVLFKICWKKSMFAIYMALSFVYGFIAGLAEAGVVEMDSLPVALLVLAFAIALLVISIKLYSNLAKAFGHGSGFAAGLIFLPFIFEPILAFDNSQYLGNPSTGFMYSPYGQQPNPYAQNSYNPYDPTNTYGQNGYNQQPQNYYNQNENAPYNPYYQQQPQSDYNKNDNNQNGNNPYNNGF